MAKTRIALKIFLLVSVLWVLACGEAPSALTTASGASSSGGQNQPPANPTPTPTPSAPQKPKYASWGTGGLGASKGRVVELKLGTGADSRYYIYIPPAYQEDQPMGLVMLFHGVEGTSNPSAFISLARYAGRDRFILVSPIGDTNDGGSGAWCQPYAREVQELVEQKYNVDLRRKYVATVSGGGLPSVLYGLHSKVTTYSYCGRSIKAGYQAEFAAFGFTASAYSPGDFSTLSGKNTADLGFTPGLWADYGELSNDKARAEDLAKWGQGLGFKTELHLRPGEGHAPQSPYSFMYGMFDMFANTTKPIK